MCSVRQAARPARVQGQGGVPVPVGALRVAEVRHEVVEGCEVAGCYDGASCRLLEGHGRRLLTSGSERCMHGLHPPATLGWLARLVLLRRT